MFLTAALMMMVQADQMDAMDAMAPGEEPVEFSAPAPADEAETAIEPRAPWSQPGEEGVEPYEISNENAGAAPFQGTAMLDAFNGRDGIRRIVERTVDLSLEDPRIEEIFRGHDMVRLRRTLFEHFCYILGGGCDYTGRSMREGHRDMGLQHADMNALVENLQRAMSEEGVPFRRQNRFLSRLAPMRPDVIER